MERTQSPDEARSRGIESKPSSPVLPVVLLVFAVFSVWVGVTDPVGWMAVVQAKWGAQIGLDLCISLSLLWTFMLRDPGVRAARPWPWMLATIVLGSIAPMLFLVIHRARARRETTPARTVNVTS